MGQYFPLEKYKWKFKRTKEGNWKAGMLFYTAAKPYGLKDLHIIASKPSGKGSYSDAHVTFGFAQYKERIFYQVNDDKLVADYVLAPKGWQSSFWINFPYLRATTEAEVLRFVAFWRDEGRLENPPRAVD
ncbi:MAG: hypothetical protein JMN24_06220 [gamma proteobacterium endosymbiont of Lamellibrachia anaximandri]|nr:hypothetical protein [gamma proteobacterium endosymbiont of Lamellibrachia anaximandri]MBL3617716.1 hypothetical protein [gamma proteobacterium endosymbiont of Lamellibrachia anaximandri]